MTKFDPDHHLLVDDGRFYRHSSQAQLDQLLDRYWKTPADTPLVVHFHGGLVDEQGGMEVAGNLLPVYRGAGGYPVFFVWRSGLLEVLQNELPRIWEDGVFQRILVHLLRFARAKVRQEAEFGIRGAMLELPPEAEVSAAVAMADERVPLAEVDPAELDARQLPPDDMSLHPAERAQLEHELEADLGLREAVQAQLAAASDVKSFSVADAVEPTLAPEVLADMRADAQVAFVDRAFVLSPSFLARVAGVMGRVLWRFARGRDHGPYATVVEEILRALYLAAGANRVWSSMKGDVEDAFRDGPDRAGTAFLRGIARRWDPAAPRRIVLVGHSTGAIYINHLLARADAELPPGVAFDVVYLAAACGFDEFARTVGRHGGRIANLRSFGMSDPVERADSLLPDAIFEKVPALRVIRKIYPHSLLYFVSGVCENEVDKPLVGMERYHSGRAPYAGAELLEGGRYLGGVETRRRWSKVSLADGLRTEAADHGEFDNDPVTRASLQHIIRSGF